MGDEHFEDDWFAVRLAGIIVAFTIGFGQLCRGLATPIPPEPLSRSEPQLEAGDVCGATNADEPPAYAEDEGGERSVLPLPGVMQDPGGSNLGRPHPSALLPLYMDGSDRRRVLLLDVVSD